MVNHGSRNVWQTCSDHGEVGAERLGQTGSEYNLHRPASGDPPHAPNVP